MIKKIPQFSVFMINKPGVLHQVCQELAQAKVNITALTMMDSMEHGVLRLVVDDSAKTRDVLGAHPCRPRGGLPSPLLLRAIRKFLAFVPPVIGQ